LLVTEGAFSMACESAGKSKYTITSATNQTLKQKVSNFLQS